MPGKPMADAEPLPEAVGDGFDLLPVPYVEISAAGVVTRANASAVRAFAMRSEEMIGKTIWELIAGDEVDKSREAFFALMESGTEPPPIRRTFRAQNGEYRTQDLYRSIIRNAEGRPSGVRCVAIDVTESVIAHEEARQARAWLESALESIGEAVIITDALGFIRSVNPAAEALTGWMSGELIGKAVEKVMPVLSYEPRDEISLSQHAMLERRMHGVALILDRKRYQLCVEITSSPILDKESGYTAGVVRILRPHGAAQP
jgi:PAS domain S-box-containing protein